MPITWKNVAAPESYAGTQLMNQGAQNIMGAAKNLVAFGQQEQRNNIGQLQTAQSGAAQASILGINNLTAEEVQQRQQEMANNPNVFQQRYGEQFGEVGSALQARQGELERESQKQSILDLSHTKDNIARSIRSGDMSFEQGREKLVNQIKSNEVLQANALAQNMSIDQYADSLARDAYDFAQSMTPEQEAALNRFDAASQQSIERFKADSERRKQMFQAHNRMAVYGQTFRNEPGTNLTFDQVVQKFKGRDEGMTLSDNQIRQIGNTLETNFKQAAANLDLPDDTVVPSQFMERVMERVVTLDKSFFRNERIDPQQLEAIFNDELNVYARDLSTFQNIVDYEKEEEDALYEFQNRIGAQRESGNFETGSIDPNLFANEYRQRRRQEEYVNQVDYMAQQGEAQPSDMMNAANLLAERNPERAEALAAQAQDTTRAYVNSLNTMSPTQITSGLLQEMSAQVEATFDGNEAQNLLAVIQRHQQRVNAEEPAQISGAESAGWFARLFPNAHAGFTDGRAGTSNGFISDDRSALGDLEYMTTYGVGDVYENTLRMQNELGVNEPNEVQRLMRWLTQAPNERNQN